MPILVIIAARNLIQARRRTFLLGLALALVTAMLVLLLALSQGIGDTMIRSATTLASGHVNVAGFFKARSSDAAPVVKDVTGLRRLIEDEVDGIENLVDRTRGWARIVSAEASIQVGLTGIDVGEEKTLLEQIRMAPEAEYLEGGRSEAVGDPSRLETTAGAIIFAGQARRLGVTVGDPLTVVAETLQGQRNSEEVTVVAIAKDIGFMSNFSVFLSKESLRRLYQLGSDVSSVVQIYLQDHTRASDIMARLRTRLTDEGFELMPHEPSPFFAKFGTVSGEAWTGQRLDTTTWRDEVSFLVWILTAVDTMSLTLVGTLLVIIAIGIMNSMWISVRERTNEIGTLRAIGMGQGEVLAMFLLESAVLGLAATSAGVVLGAGVAVALDAARLRVPLEAVQAILMTDTLHLVVNPIHLVGAVLGFTVLAALSALWPALRASRLAPVTAIHHVG